MKKPREKVIPVPEYAPKTEEERTTYLNQKLFHVVKALKPFAKKARAHEQARWAKKRKGLEAEEASAPIEEDEEKTLLDKITSDLFADLLFHKALQSLPREIREALPTQAPLQVALEDQKSKDFLARLFATKASKEGKEMVMQTVVKHLTLLETWEEARVTQAEQQKQIEAEKHEAMAKQRAMRAEHRESRPTKTAKKERKPPKNRLGQRARRELYEKRFGEQANHIQKGEEWVSKEMQPLNRKMKRAQARQEEEKTKNTSADPTLHPSWKAKMAQKEAEEARKKEAAAVKPTKIRFD